MWSCYTFDENIDNLNSEQQKEIEFYKNLIHFLNLSDKLIFLCDSKNELKDERINELINKFSTEEKKIEKKIFYLNNKIIYENNNEKENEDEWNKLMDNVNKLKDMIKKEKSKEVKNNEFFEYLLKDNESEVRQYFEKLENKAQHYFNYFLAQIKYEKEKDRSNIFMAVINKIIRKINEGHKTIIYRLNLKNELNSYRIRFPFVVHYLNYLYFHQMYSKQNKFSYLKFLK